MSCAVEGRSLYTKISNSTSLMVTIDRKSLVLENLKEPCGIEELGECRFLWLLVSSQLFFGNFWLSAEVVNVFGLTYICSDILIDWFIHNRNVINLPATWISRLPTCT